MMYVFVLKRRHPWGADAANKLIATNLALGEKKIYFFPVSKEQSNDGAFYKCFANTFESTNIRYLFCSIKGSTSARLCAVLLHLSLRHTSGSNGSHTGCLTGSGSTWKWYKSTVVQEAFAISSLLRHKHITVPPTQTTTTWDPAQRWNFPTDRETH